jgi:hypothetical protein
MNALDLFLSIGEVGKLVLLSCGLALKPVSL